MNIGIIECGPVPAALQARYGSYPDMFAAQLAPLLPGARFATVSVVSGDALTTPEAMDAWLLTGSRHGVYDDLPWIAPLKAFIRDAARIRRPVVGVCFGHQIIAEAMGGRVEKAAIGWRVGLERYTTHLNGKEAVVALPAFHQDQVIAKPPGAEIVAHSPACPHAALRYAPAPILSLQFHPEFSRPYLADLINVLAKQAEPPGLPADAVPEDAPEDTGMRWIAAFLAQHRARS